MDFDIDLSVEVHAESIHKDLEALIADKYHMRRHAKHDTEYVISKIAPIVGNNLDNAITDFLSDLTKLRGVITTLKTSLRIGVFYQLAETVVFPVMLSKKTIELLYQFRVDLDITGYPCDE